MNAEAQAWSEQAFEADVAGSVAGGGAGSAPVNARRVVAGAPSPRRQQRTADRAPKGVELEAEGVSWNVLAQELVPFPRRAKRILLEETSEERGRTAAARDDRQDAARARRYGEAWLERELIAIRYRADAGYPALDRRMLGTVQPATIERSVVGHPAAGRPATSRSSTGRAARHLDTSDPERRACDLREATPTRAGVAAEPRGLRRLLPGVATLAALAGIWAGAGLLATVHRPPLGVLPGSVKTPAGYVYVVRPGDTLWSIASRLQPGGDPRVLVAKLERQVSAGTLEPGSRLMLP